MCGVCLKHELCFSLFRSFLAFLAAWDLWEWWGGGQTCKVSAEIPCRTLPSSNVWGHSTTYVPPPLVAGGARCRCGCHRLDCPVCPPSSER